MPRTIEEVNARAEELARRFEDYEPSPGDMRDAAPLRAVREAFEGVAAAQCKLADAVSVARAEGHSWMTIGAMVGTTGEAARQRFGRS